MASGMTPGEQNARKFFEEIQREHGNLTAVHSDLVRVARDRGYECTIEDLDKVLRDLWARGERVVYSEPPGF